MILIHENGVTSTPRVGQHIKGCRIKTATLDKHDLDDMRNLNRDLHDFVHSLSDIMIKPEPTLTELKHDSGLVYNDEEEDVITKPPLGLVPHTIWVDKRRVDILAAIDRYEDADLTVPLMWIKELKSLKSYVSEQE